MTKVLVVDDNPSVIEAITMLLDLNEIDFVSASSPAQALKTLADEESVAVVLQDMNFDAGKHSGMQGRELFFCIRDRFPSIPVVLMTAWTQLEMAVELIKEGAADYLAKPWDDNKLVATLRNLIELGELKKQQYARQQALQNARESLVEKATLCGIVYQSETMQSLVELAVRVARSDVPVLITGPNGAGKEKIAEIVQANSSVASGSFVKVNVGALPEDLIEAELFGAEAGAYTGSTKLRRGRFEIADGGTLFLDEIGNLSASGQAKLLRVLQTGEFERLGSSKTQHCVVRVISATNADLLEEVKAGRFREDLYYRLNVIELNLPPLNERPEDILPLLRNFIGREKQLSRDAVRVLQSYHWPGNVRELENTCRRAIVVAQSEELKVEDFGIVLDQKKSKNDMRLQEPSESLIKQVLLENCGVVAQAAQQLGLSRQALYRRMEKYNIQAKQ